MNWSGCWRRSTRLAVQAWYRQQARAQGYTDVRCGSVTFVQRFGSALNLHPHFHVLMQDGVYVGSEEGVAPVFVPAPPLGDADVQRLVEIAAHRLVRLLQQRGILAALSAASIQGQLATGPRTGRRVRRLLSDPIEGRRSERLCFSAWCFSLHATTCIGAADRAGLERLCRLGWAALLARVFALDVTLCPACSGRLRLVAVRSDPAAIRSYLSGVGLAAEPPAIAAARPPPQRALELVV